MNIFAFIKSRVSITDVVQEYVTLKKMGLYLKGQCPFHHERTGSFTVSPHRDIFYCFGCHKGGDVISFISEAEHCTPFEAVQHLAERYHIALPEDSYNQEKHELKTHKLKRYNELCHHFAQWCHNQLSAENNNGALDYCLKRGISVESIKHFTLGYFTENALADLLEYLRSKGFIAQDLIDAHILHKGKQGLYSPFNQRIIFPIRDYLGRVCGFGGRIFKSDDVRPKYYNSQDHPFFTKGHVLFGLDRAKKAIQNEQSAFLVEGYLDCIAMAQAGYTSTVATLGTATTIDHLKLLGRYAQRLYIVFDGDNAGQQAITKLTHLSWASGMELSVITLPEKEDPASLLQKEKSMSGPIENAQDIFIFFMQRLGSGYQTKPMQERLAILEELLEAIHCVQDPLKRSFLLQKASATFSIPLEVLERPVLPQAEKPLPDQKVLILPLERQLFMTIFRKGLSIKKEDEELIHKNCREDVSLLIGKLLLYIKDKNPYQENDFLAMLSNEERECAISLIMHGEEDPEAEMDELLKPLWKKEWRTQATTIKLQLHQAEQTGSHMAVQEIMKAFTNLKAKMREKGIL